MPVTPGKEGVRQEMHKFKVGTLHSGSKKGPIVKNRKQAIAIALNEAGMSKKKRGGPVIPTINDDESTEAQPDDESQEVKHGGKVAKRRLDKKR